MTKRNNSSTPNRTSSRLKAKNKSPRSGAKAKQRKVDDQRNTLEIEPAPDPALAGTQTTYNPTENDPNDKTPIDINDTDEGKSDYELEIRWRDEESNSNPGDTKEFLKKLEEMKQQRNESKTDDTAVH